jgi:hypothetical protein
LLVERETVLSDRHPRTAEPQVQRQPSIAPTVGLIEIAGAPNQVDLVEAAAAKLPRTNRRREAVDESVERLQRGGSLARTVGRGVTTVRLGALPAPAARPSRERAYSDSR